MDRWGLAEIAADAELLASELATNAVQHATGSSFTVAIRVSGGLLLVEVFDAEPRLPGLSEPDPRRESGRGLATVAALATDWGVSRHPPGKCVWFALQLPSCLVEAERHAGLVALSADNVKSGAV